MKWTAVLSCVLCSSLIGAQETTLKADATKLATNPFYLASYYPGYYPGVRGAYPGYYNPYNFGRYLGGYNPFNYLPRYFPQAAPAAPAPSAPAAPVDMTQGTQYHFQDNMGNINYGYSNINSAKHESGNTYGGVQGEYSYVDANGIQQVVSYVADDNGFRIISDSRLQSLDTYGQAAPAPAANFESAPAPIESAAPLTAVPEARKKREADAYYGYSLGYHPYGNLPYYNYQARPYHMGYYGNGFGYYYG